MRKIQVIGNLTKDAEVKHLQGGKSVINFDLACNERYLKDGVKQVKVYYIKCALWRDNTAIAQYLTKGSKIYVEGLPDVDTYINKEGKAVGSVKIIVREIEFCTSVKKTEAQPATNTPASSTDDDFPPSNSGEDLPF